MADSHDGVVAISPAQLGYLLSGLDWRHSQETLRPTSVAPPAALYYASRDRRHEHPERHLPGFGGILGGRVQWLQHALRPDAGWRGGNRYVQALSTIIWRTWSTASSNDC